MWAPWLDVQGWAVSPGGTVERIEVFLDDESLSELHRNVRRPDVALAFPGSDPECGFDTRLLLPAGIDAICELMIRVTDNAGLTSERRRTLHIAGSRPLHLALDAPLAETVLSDIVTVRGWAISAEGPIRTIEAWLDEISLGTVDGREARPDAAGGQPGCCASRRPGRH